MTTQSKLMLGDGTPFDALFNLERREVSMRAMADQSLYELELDQLFGKGWNLLGHESEIPDAGDYIVRAIGEDDVIVARDRQGDIHVSLNVCPHRGMRLALGEQGNASVHKCIYHGWAFRPNGDFVGAPVEREQMHGEICSKAELGLKKARVALYGGLVFATWNIDGPSLDDYLGEAKFYLDMLFDRTDRGLEVLGAPQKVMLDCSWKTLGEQSGGDGFHTLSLHRWMMDLGLFRTADGEGEGDPSDNAPAMYGVNISANGHNARCIPIELTFAHAKNMDVDKMTLDDRIRLLPPPGVTPELAPQLRNHLSDAQIELLVKMPPQVGGMFPNIQFAFVYAPQSDGTLLGALGMHVMVPRGLHKSEFYTWIFAEKDCPEEMKQKMLRSSVQQLGTSGLIEQDDTDTWPHISKNARGAIARKHMTLKYQAFTGEKKPEGWPGGGKVYEGFAKDDTQWEWWLAYRQAMTQAAG